MLNFVSRPIAVLVLLTATGVLVGCNAGKQTEEAAVAGTEAAPAKAPIAPGKPLTTPLPDGIVLSTPINAVYDRELAAADGSPRRRIIVEFLDGDVNTISAEIDTQMKQAGYRKGKPRDEKGGTRVNYARRADDARVSVLVLPRLEQRFRDERALGTVSFSWKPGKPQTQTQTQP